MSDLKQAVERLSRVASEPGCDVVVDSADLRLVLSALSRAEAERDEALLQHESDGQHMSRLAAERDLLAAECRAWREERNAGRDLFDIEQDPEALEKRYDNARAAVVAARAATDAAGVLEVKL